MSVFFRAALVVRKRPTIAGTPAARLWIAPGRHVLVLLAFLSAAWLHPVQPGWVARAGAERERTARARIRLAGQLFRHGLRLMARGQYREALEALERSFKLRPRAVVLLAIGQCYELAGQPEEARRIYLRLLQGPAPADLDVALVKQRLALVNQRHQGHGPSPASQPSSRPSSQQGLALPPWVGAEPLPPMTAEDSGEDRVEDLDLEPTKTGGKAAETSPAPSEVSGLLSGWYKLVLYHDLSHDRADGPTDLLENSLEMRNRFLLRLDIRYGGWLEAFGSVIMDHVVREQPPNGGTTFVLVNGRSATTELNADAVEAFLRVNRWKLEGRVGLLRVPWGACDFFSPNDVINPLDQRNPALEETELLRLPVLAAEVSFNHRALTIDLIWQPFFRQDRLALFGNDFGLISPRLAPPLRGLFKFLGGQFDPGLTPTIEDLLLQTNPLPNDLTASAGGMRARLELKGIDLGAYYHYGWNTVPQIEIASGLTAMMGAVDWSTVRLRDLAPLLGGADSLSALYQTSYLRRHHVGGEIVGATGSVVLRAEVGYDSQRVFLDQALHASPRNALSAAGNIEYQYAEDKLALVEFSYLKIFDAPSQRLLFYRPYSVSVGMLVRWAFLRGDLNAEVRAVLTLRPWGYLVRPQLRYQISRRWSVHAGALLLGGEDLSFGEYYDRNDLVLVGATVAI